MSTTENPEVRGRHLTWFTASAALASASLLRAARGYRPFPSIDDFAYVPMGLARLYPDLYPHDVLLRETPLHTPLLPPFLAATEATTGLPLGFLLTTVILSLVTSIALWRLMRALGVAGAFLPVVLVVVCAGRVQGLGRAEYDGIFGDAFHFQWAALCALLWAYDGVLRRRWRRAVGLLFLASALHPAVGAHGILAVLCGFVFVRVGGTRARAWLVPVTVGTCALVAVFAAVGLRGGGGGPVTTLPEAARSFFFRLPHEFEFDQLKLWLVLLFTAIGISGLARLAREECSAPVAGVLGLLLGHLLLLAAACVLYDHRLVTRWGTWTVIPFQLSLSRTTTLLMALSAVSAAAALEAVFLGPKGERQSLRGSEWLITRGFQVTAVLFISVMHVRWSWLVGLCCGIAAVTAIVIRERRGWRALTAVYVLLLAGALGLFGRSASLAAQMSDHQEQLLEWARSNTPPESLFIIPPGFQEFRIHARRSVYVDFKTVTPANTRLMALWRQRLEQVAAPDALGQEARGWAGVVEWDRTYAGRNTPTRIAWLLRETGADFFVWDRQGLAVPPFVRRERVPDDSLTVVFENDRYVTYHRSVGHATGATRESR